MAVLIVLPLHKPNRPLPSGVKVGKPHSRSAGRARLQGLVTRCTVSSRMPATPEVVGAYLAAGWRRLRGATLASACCCVRRCRA